MGISQDILFPQIKDLPPSLSVPWIQGRILINGKILSSENGKQKEVLSPCVLQHSNGSLFHPPLGTTPEVSPACFLEAVEGAAKAWKQGRGEWPTSKLEKRIHALQSLLTGMKQKRQMICHLLMWEIAKSQTDAEAEFDRTLIYLQDTLEAAQQLDRSCNQLQLAGGLVGQTRRTPLGVALCLGPFNYPLNETFAMLIPLLVMGNVAVVKVPRFGQLFWDCLLELFQTCFPPGVVQILNGSGKEILPPAIQSGKINILAFIGSSQVARQLKQAHPHPHRLRSILGLDAKNLGIILPDAPWEESLRECLKGAFSFNGQRCTALKMLFIHHSLSSKWTAALRERTQALRCGLPWEPQVQITPLADPQKAGQLQRYFEEALSQGAQWQDQPCPPQSRIQGPFFLPTVLSQVSLKSRIAHEEQFGPLLPIVEYQDFEEVEDYVLQSPYGMQVSLFGESAQELGPKIDFFSHQVCRMNLNTQCQRGPDLFPFTGRKDSAEGTLSVSDALRAFSIRSLVVAPLDDRGKKIIRSIVDEKSSSFLHSHFILE